MRQNPRIIFIGAFSALVIIVVVTLLIRSSFSDRGTLVATINLTDLPPGEHIVMHIDSIDLWHSERGWYTVDNRERAFSTSNSVDAPLERTLTLAARSGTYERVRISLSRFEQMVDTDEREPFFMLLDTMVFTIPVTIEADAHSALRVSLAVNASLYAVDETARAFIPQIHIESRSGVTVLEEGDTVRISGGSLLQNQTYGMTPDGSMRANYRLPSDATLILENGDIRISSLPEIVTPVELIERELAEEARAQEEEPLTSNPAASEDLEADAEAATSTSATSSSSTNNE